MPPPAAPPYFDVLFARLIANDPDVRDAFGRHVHWGYWPDRTMADGDRAAISAAEYGAAAERLCREVCDAAKVAHGQRVLDVGCGLGGAIASLNERFQPLALTGLNIDPRQLDYAREHVAPCQHNRIAWVEGDACRLPFDAATFDVVLAVECVFHFDRRRFLDEACRVLRPGGRIALSDFCLVPRVAEYLAPDSFVADVSLRQSYGQIDFRWSLDDYRRYAAENALAIVCARDVTQQTLPTYDFLLPSQGASSAADNPDFVRATRLLAKASRKGLLQYVIVALEQP